MNIIGKWSDESVLTRVFLKLLYMMQLVIMLSMAVAVHLVILVGLFNVVIVLHSNIKFTKLVFFVFFKVEEVNIIMSCKKTFC